MKELSIIIFGYNEENLIQKTIEEIINLSDSKKDKFEIIVVNDGSTDKTQSKIEFVKNKYERIISILDKKYKEGIAKAVLDGIDKSKYKFVTWIPADGAYNSSSLIHFFNNDRNKELIIGYRNNKKNRIFNRYFLSEFLTKILNLIFLKKIKDYNGVIILNKKLLKKINFILKPAFQWIIIIQLLKLNIKYDEIGIKMKIPEPGNPSSSINIKIFLSYFFSLLYLIFIFYFK